MRASQKTDRHKTHNRVLHRLLSAGFKGAASFFILICSFSQTASASDNQLVIVTDNQRSLHHQFITQLKNHLTAQNTDNITIRIVSSNDWNPQISNQSELTLVLGSNAALKIRQHKLAHPVLFNLIPSITYQQVIRTAESCSSEQCSAIFIDQPLTRTVALMHIALPQVKTAGLLISRKSTTDLKELSAIAEKQDIRIQYQQTDNPDNLIFKLTDILKKSDALLSIPDPGIYRRHTVQNILLTTYRHRKPMIGYSRAFVKAGALFAVYSSPTQLSQQTADVIAQFFSGTEHKLPAPQYPRYFSVSVNRMVAKSLGIDMQSEKILKEQLEAINNE